MFGCGKQHRPQAAGPTKVSKLRPLFFLAAFLASFSSQVAMADWSFNLGYHNPPGSLVGLNFLYMGSPWGFELGVGWIDVATEETTTSGLKNRLEDQVTVYLGGDVNVKYFLAAGNVRPYLQGGFGMSLGSNAGDTTGAHASTGGAFGGLGLLLGGKPLYVYLAYSIARSPFLQAGIGFDL